MTAAINGQIYSNSLWKQLLEITEMLFTCHVPGVGL